MDSLSKLCFATTEGVSLLGINEAANILGLHTTCARATTSILNEVPLPCIIHWNQNHFVVLYKVKKGKRFYIADPGKGLVTYSLEEFKKHWISTRSNEEDKGIAMFLETTPAFFTYKMEGEKLIKEKRSFRFLFGYVKKYRKYFGQIILGLIIGSLLQLVLPFLTQSIVDVGIKDQDIGFVWLNYNIICFRFKAIFFNFYFVFTRLDLVYSITKFLTVYSYGCGSWRSIKTNLGWRS